MLFVSFAQVSTLGRAFPFVSRDARSTAAFGGSTLIDHENGSRSEKGTCGRFRRFTWLFACYFFNQGLEQAGEHYAAGGGGFML